MKKQIFASLTVLADDNHRRAADLQLDSDGRYRWYERATGANTEVSGATIDEAKLAAAHAWGSPIFDLRADWL